MESKTKSFLLDNGRLPYEAVRRTFDLVTLEIFIGMFEVIYVLKFCEKQLTSIQQYFSYIHEAISYRTVNHASKTMMLGWGCRYRITFAIGDYHH